MNIIALLAGLFSGIIASMGMGGGAVLLIYLNLFTEYRNLTAQGINLIFFIPTAIISLIIYIKNKEIKFKKVIPVAAFGIAGSALGLYLTSVISAEILTKFFACFLIIIGIKEFFAKK